MAVSSTVENKFFKATPSKPSFSRSSNAAREYSKANFPELYLNDYEACQQVLFNKGTISGTIRVWRETLSCAATLEDAQVRLGGAFIRNCVKGVQKQEG
jgi:hypothetical protein